MPVMTDDEIERSRGRSSSRRDARPRRRDRRRHRRPGARLHGRAGVRRPAREERRRRPDRRLPGRAVRDHDVPARSGAGRGLAPHGVRPQQRRSWTAFRASRSSPTAARTSAAPCSRTGRSSTGREKVEPATARGRRSSRRPGRRLRLPLPRRPVRPGGQPHRGPAGARARPLRVRDPQRPPRPARHVQRLARRRHRRGREDPQVHARRSRASTSTASSSWLYPIQPPH